MLPAPGDPVAAKGRRQGHSLWSRLGRAPLLRSGQTPTATFLGKNPPYPGFSVGCSSFGSLTLTPLPPGTCREDGGGSGESATA